MLEKIFRGFNFPGIEQSVNTAFAFEIISFRYGKKQARKALRNRRVEKKKEGKE